MDLNSIFNGAIPFLKENVSMYGGLTEQAIVAKFSSLDEFKANEQYLKDYLSKKYFANSELTGTENLISYGIAILGVFLRLPLFVPALGMAYVRTNRLCYADKQTYDDIMGHKRGVEITPSSCFENMKDNENMKYHVLGLFVLKLLQTYPLLVVMRWIFNMFEFRLPSFTQKQRNRTVRQKKSFKQKGSRQKRCAKQKK